MFPSETLGSDPPDDPSGSRGTYFLGRYRVVDEIGVGGMASVHLARMDGPGGFQKWAAIKKIHSHLVEDGSVIQMFLDEARVAARISHPNVATVFDLGTHASTYWIAMEYLHGEPLREVMRCTDEAGTAVPPEIACRLIADAAEGLHAAHELVGNDGENLNLVHRDVTPHNIFVTFEGVTKVVDFGIAKFSSRANHTRAGILKGKLAYMSPEQAQSGAIDRRTDIFALGVVLWELTTGQRLFWMDSDIDTFIKVEECQVPLPSTLIQGYPLDLEKVVMKALAKDPNERFATAREFSRALQSILMRRDLFVSSDEVAQYMQQLFGDRIQKRDEHLRWAAEVTKTITVDRRAAPIATGKFARPQTPVAPVEISDTILASAAAPALGAPIVVRSQRQSAPEFAPPAAPGNVIAPEPRPPRRRPAWVVAAVSASLAFLIAGIVLAFIGMTQVHRRADARTTDVLAPSTSPAAPTESASADPSNQESTLGKLTVTCLGAKCAEITDNGAPLGPGDVSDRSVAAGVHVLVLSGENGVTKTVNVVIIPKQATEVHMTMD
jgi:serine/threonine-protein kinase